MARFISKVTDLGRFNPSTVSFPLKSADELLMSSKPSVLFTLSSPPKASRPTISLGALAAVQNHAQERKTWSKKWGWKPRKIPQKSGNKLPKVVLTVTRNAALAELTASPTSRASQLLGLPARMEFQRRPTCGDLPSRRWAAGREPRTSTQPASSRVSNFLGGAFAESLFLQKHRST